MSTKFSANSKKLVTLSSELSERFGEHFFQNVPLSSYVSSRVGGVAEFLVVAKRIEDLIDAGKIAIKFKRDYRVISGGTGVLISEVGYPDLVIINQTSGVMFSQGASTVIVSSGESNQVLIAAAASKNLGGIEFLSGVPGTLGGAVVTNATYDGQSIGAFVKSITIQASDGQECKIITIPAAEMNFKPMESLLLKQSKFPPIVLNITLQLARLPQEEIVKRLRKHRQRNAEIDRDVMKIGGFLRPSIDQNPGMFREFRKLKLPNIKLSPETGIMYGIQSKTSVADFKNAVISLRRLATDLGVELEERISYLGYWPDGESNEE